MKVLRIGLRNADICIVISIGIGVYYGENIFTAGFWALHVGQMLSTLVVVVASTYVWYGLRSERLADRVRRCRHGHRK